ncbi:MAG TPA: ATP-binding protein [Candidatus Binatia bacterium]|jgi:signal transduction histidine kinase
MEEKANILVVDDETGPRESLKVILKPYYNVYAVEKAADAIEMLNLIPVDLVTLDLKMPGLSGTKVLEKIKEHDPDIEAIIITGYGSMDTAVEGLRLGAFDYISKPFDVKHILGLVRRALQRRQARVELKNVKSEFLANISHELRTPLSVVIGFVSILLDQLIGQLTEQQQKALERVYKNSGELLELIDNVLTLTSLNAGDLVLVEEEFDAAAMARECVSRYRKLIDEKSIAISVQAPAELRVTSDSAKVARIVQNLLHNAIKFTPAGKKITLKLGKSQKKDFLQIDIADTGMGMPEQHIERLFQPFQQMDSTLRRQFSGLGLGLTVARRLTDFLGGTLQIKSERDLGTQVAVEIPNQPAHHTDKISRHSL